MSVNRESETGRMTVARKIMSGYGVVILLILIISIFTWFSLQNSRKIDSELTEKYYPLVEKLRQLDAMVKSTIQLNINWINLPNPSDKEALRNILGTEYPELKEEIFALTETGTQGDSVIRSFLIVYDNTIPAQESIMKGLQTEDDYTENMLELSMVQGSDVEQPLQALAIQGAIKAINLLIEEQSRRKFDAFDRVQYMLVILTILAIVFSLVIGYLITKNIMGTLGGEPAEVAEMVSRISKGDLSVNFEDRIYTGLYGNIKMMVKRLREIVGDIAEGANSVNQASNQMSETAQQISYGSSQQAANSEEVSSSMQEMASNIRDNAEHTSNAGVNSQHLTKLLNKSNSSLNATVGNIKVIIEKISVISDIARQTNILSLNAAVEAARAGEAGKGFAVIASEIRKLSEVSQLSADDINSISVGSIKNTEETEAVFKELTDTINENSEIIIALENAGKEQDSGARQINSAIQELNSIVQQNAASSEELAASSEELSAQAAHMKNTISYFKLKKA